MKKYFNNLFQIIRKIIYFFKYYLRLVSFLRSCHFERLEREMNDDSNIDGGRFDTGTIGDLDRMVIFNSILFLLIFFILG